MATLNNTAKERMTTRSKLVINSDQTAAQKNKPRQSAPISPQTPLPATLSIATTSAGDQPQLQQQASFYETYTQAAVSASSKLMDISSRMIIKTASLFQPQPATLETGSSSDSVIPPGSPIKENQGQRKKLIASHFTAGSEDTSALSLKSRAPFYDLCAEIVSDRFFVFLPTSNKHHGQLPQDAVVFSVDSEYIYVPFFADCGPLSMSNVIRFDRSMRQKLSDPALRNKRFVLVASTAPDKFSNAILLALSHLVLSHGMTDTQAWEVLPKRNPAGGAGGQAYPLMTFRDAGYGPATYWISIQDCLHALFKGITAQSNHSALLAPAALDTTMSDFYEKVENGDLNWLIPGFFLGMASPQEVVPAHVKIFHDRIASGMLGRGSNGIAALYDTYTPLVEIEKMCRAFVSKDNHPDVQGTDIANIKAVIRLNNKLYERERFIANGVDHYELFYPDGSVPDIEQIVRPFMDLCDAYLPHEKLGLINPHVTGGSSSHMLSDRVTSGRGALAIHCKAGLGRTGTLICCWMMSRLGWTARECISWCRLMRPGSVVGPQQNWLETVEPLIKKRFPHISASTTVIVDAQEEASLSINNGTDALATSTVGMNVPQQPRKHPQEQQTLQAELMNDVEQKFEMLAGTKRRHSKVDATLPSPISPGS